MIPIDQPLPVGYCQHCREECRDRLGVDVYPGRPDLADKTIWVCVFCGARVGSHEEGPKKGQALGTAANVELRRAREHCHKLIDPLWMEAWRLYPDASRNPDQKERMKALAIIKRKARTRVYAYMADRVGLSTEACHIAMMDIEQCRAAYRAMRGISYSEIRDQAKATPPAG